MGNWQCNYPITNKNSINKKEISGSRDGRLHKYHTRGGPNSSSRAGSSKYQGRRRDWNTAVSNNIIPFTPANPNSANGT